VAARGRHRPRRLAAGAPSATPALRAVVARLLDEADRLYQRANQGVAELPADCRAAILAASQIYGEIGHQLRREGLDSVNHRTVVGTSRKLVLLAASWTQVRWIRQQPHPPAPLAAIAYLVDGCAGQPQRVAMTGFPNRALPQRVAWVLDLLERREHTRRAFRA